MADNIFRTTRRDPAAQGVPQDDDPLAELARLIGRTEPQGRAARQHEAPPLNAPEPSPAWPADARYAEPQPAPPSVPYVEPQPRYAEPQLRYDQRQDLPSDQYAAPHAGQYDDRRYDEHRELPQPAETYPPYRAAPPSYHADDEQPDPYAAPAPRYDTGGHDQPPYDEPARYEDHPRYDDAHDPIQDLPAFLPRARDERRDQQRDDRYDYAEEGARDDDQSYALEDYEDDEEPPRKRRGFAIVAGLLGLMVLGTAGAFGYRTMFGGSMMPSLPPIIKADDTPNKIVPSGTASASSQAAANNSRAPDQLVSREERPVDVPVPANAPRVVSTIPVFPDPNAGLQASMVPGQPQPGQNMPGSIAPGGPGNVGGMPMQLGPTAAAPAYGASAAPAAPDQSAQPPVAGTSGSKKIHTVAIHAGQSDSADTAAPAPAPASSAHAPTSARPAVPRSVAAPPQGGQSGSAPLSIVPSPSGGDTPHTRTALAHPAATAPAEPAPAAAGGGYLVQVSSQRSEAEAQEAYRGLQAKYPAQLGGHTPTVRQVDLGDKGVFYRTLVGPYASADEAARMCASLKAAGGSCLVQRN
jgi:cell division septation protein DedD